MLQRVMQDLKGDRIQARDGPIGSVHDVYFDDERWAVRYLVVDTGEWLPGKRVLISPASVPRQEGDGDYIRVALTREQVEHAPGTDEDPPVSRMLEAAHAQYYGYPYYWTGPYLWGPVPMPLAAPPAEQAQRAPSSTEREIRQAAEQRARESHLRSSSEVVGYAIRAVDGEIGHVEDFVVDDRTWAIADMVVDTRNWLPGKKVLVPPEAISDIDWDNRQVSVKLRREELKRSPEAS
jgi:sporulation protein YlmC with PRC-barrel domain